MLLDEHWDENWVKDKQGIYWHVQYLFISFFVLPILRCNLVGVDAQLGVCVQLTRHCLVYVPSRMHVLLPVL
jgi:hypothetical protein